MDGGELERREWDDAIRNPSRSMDGLGLQCSCLVEWSSYEPLSSRPRWECCSSSLCPVSPWRYQQSYPQPVSCPPTNMHCAGVLEVGKNVESILYLDGSFIILTRWTQGLFAGGKRKAKNSQLFPSNETPFFLDFVIQKFSNLVFNNKKTISISFWTFVSPLFAMHWRMWTSAYLERADLDLVEFGRPLLPVDGDVFGLLVGQCWVDGIHAVQLVVCDLQLQQQHFARLVRQRQHLNFVTLDFIGNCAYFGSFYRFSREVYWIGNSRMKFDVSGIVLDVLLICSSFLTLAIFFVFTFKIQNLKSMQYLNLIIIMLWEWYHLI